MRRIVPWALAVLAIAVLVHAIAIATVPRIIMARVASQIGQPNMMHVGKRPDASSRGIVRPSADLLYAICPYDVSGNHTLLVTASMPERTYWSIAGYDDDTNNFFVRDNRQSGSVRINIYGSDRSSGVNDLGAVRSPTARGIVIVRILIDSEGHLGTLETAQKSARCTIQP